jgi:opacity protein-like surface antigen
MSRKRPLINRVVGSLSLGLLALLAAPPAAAQRGGASGAGFLFREPRGTVGVRGGRTFARADSDLFDFVAEQLTIEDGDFDASTLGVDVALRWKPRLDLVLGVEYSRASVQSEFRDYVDQNDMPITQETRLTQLPLTASVKYYLTPRGRRVGNYAWVPKSVAPYLGGGAGLVRYEFEQVGDFVDFVDLSIFTTAVSAEGWASTLHAFAGLDLTLTPRLFLGLEARYAWGEGELGQDFVDFEPIDLAGLRTTAGLHVRF